MAIETDIAQTNDHRYSAPARQYRHMARGAALGQRDGAALGPVRLQEQRRRDVIANQYGARLRQMGLLARQMAQHAIAHVFQIGGTRPEIIIIGHLIAQNLGIDRPAPSIIGGPALVDQSTGGFEQRIILEQGDLKTEHLGALAFGRLDQCRQAGDRRQDRSVKSTTLGIWIT